MTNTYQPEGFALEIFKKRYALHDAETWEQACERVANHVAAAENGEEVVKYRTKFTDLLKSSVFIPAGRIWYGSGRPKGQLQNCFVIGTSDSREGWGDTVRDMIVIAGTGGGLGVNCSPVRPRGTEIKGHSGKATGAISLMEIINAAGEVIKAGGGRRTALMLSLAITHGDIEEFLDKKLDLNQLNNANISVWFDDDPEIFFDKVKKNQQLKLIFNGTVTKSVSARALWHKIISNALKSGEPGLLNGYLANKTNNIWYVKKLINTNPCGEQMLEDQGSCCLGALVLSRFVDGSTIRWGDLKEATISGVRFLDDVLSVNNYPTQSIQENCLNLRRIGLGIMALHDMLLKLGLRYNSDEGLEMVNKVMKFIKNTAYEASVDLAAEKGVFPKFEADKFLESGFTKTLKPSIRSAIKEKGIRNCALLTIAPTGTTSMVAGVTSGIEPMFAPAYLRRYRDGDALKEEVVIHPLFRQFVDEGRSVKHFQGAHDLKIRDHFEMQRTCQKHLDNACSKTINLPPGTSEEELSDLYMEFFPELKGVTVYPDGSRENQPLTPMSLDEALRHAKTATVGAAGVDSCKDGKCDI